MGSSADATLIYGVVLGEDDEVNEILGLDG